MKGFVGSDEFIKGFVVGKKTGTLDKVKEWLNQEVSELKQELEEQVEASSLKDWTVDSPRFKGFPYYHTMQGELECAETLLRRIDEWEGENNENTSQIGE